MAFNYMAFPMQGLGDGDYVPGIGEVVRVRTYAGSALIAEVVADRRDGYELKYPSEDGLRILRKTVPHWVGFARIDKTLAAVAAARFRAAGGAGSGQLEAFRTAWGEAGLRALLALSAEDPN